VLHSFALKDFMSCYTGPNARNDKANTEAVVEWLRKQDLTIDVKNEFWVTPLFLSARRGHNDPIDNMEALLQLNADANQLNNKG
jgi:hypothetical protein